MAMTRKRESPADLHLIHVFFSRNEPEKDIGSGSDDREERWALVWKTKRGRRKIIVLVCLLSRNRKLKDYQDTLYALKLEAKKMGYTRLTDSLDIVKSKSGWSHHDPALWWLSLFSNNDEVSVRDRYQWVRFGRDSKGARAKYQFSSTNIRSGTEWSLILDVLNNCDSIEEIMESGKLPEVVSVKKSKSPSPAIGYEQDTMVDDSRKRILSFSPLSLWRQTFISTKSITGLHLGTFHTMNQSPIAIIRCTQSFFALLGNHALLDTNNMSRTQDRSIIPSQIELSKERLTRWNTFLSSLFDMAFGFGVAAILIYLLCNPKSLGEALTLNLSVKENVFQYLKDRIAWLETFPAGFKLNEQLTDTMGRGIRSLLDRYKFILLATIWDPRIRSDFLVPALAAIAGLGGWTSFLASVLDLWRLEIIHVTVLTECFRKLYQAELFLLSALFRLFRGKKRNVLRQRTDTMKYDAMQLLVGTIAFCVCVFLWTTIMVYYTFFLIWNLSMHLPLMACSVVYLLSRSFPFGSLLFRVLKPHWFPEDLYIQTGEEIAIRKDSNATIQVVHLVSVLQSPGSILSGAITAPLKRLFNWYLVSFLEILYPRSSHKSHSFLPSNLLVDEAKF